MSATASSRNPASSKDDSDATDNNTTPQNERDNNDNDNENENENDNEDDEDDDAKTSMPMQKRRRVTRACDECRRKKIKCDGKQPCTHCTVYSYDCTYDQPSNRRRNPAPQYIEALEQRLQKAEALLRSVLPGIELDDPKFDAHGVEQILESNKRARQRPIQSSSQKATQPSPPKSDDDAHMKSMVDRTGSLDLDDTGNYDYHGHSSGYSFMRRFRAQFGESFLPVPQSYQIHSAHQPTVHESPKSLLSSPLETSAAYMNDLPSRQTAITLCSAAIDECCALHRPLHRPTFFKRLHAVYDTDPEHWNNDHIKFLPLLYVVMAVGCLFGHMEDDPNDVEKRAYKLAVNQGYQFFNNGKSMIDVTDCRDIMSIQTVTFMIFFLQGTAKLATCYAYVGVALRACCRLGMHRNLKLNFNCIEQEERKRIFWQVRRMDGYIGAMLGLPQMLSDEDIDQDLPAETDDENITEEMVKPMPPGRLSLMKATNAHTQLMKILHKAVRYVYPVRPQHDDAAGAGYSIKHSLIKELEKDLQQWMNDLPVQLMPSENSDIELSRVQQLLRTSYAYVQMMIYRPFLHYVSQACQSGNIDRRSFACAAACVSVARNIVHITTEMRKRGLLAGAYWFVMYTTYFAILSLIYFVLENPDSATSNDILKEAREGRDTLAILARRSMAADRCTASLVGLFEVLPAKLIERRASLQPVPASRKRTLPGDGQPLPTHFGNMDALTNTRSPVQHRARTLPHEYLAKAAKRNSMQDPSSAMHSPYTQNSEPALTTSSTPSVRSLNYPQLSHDLSTVDFNTPTAVQGQLSDLKNVMFPGDNPFAYGNQPISTLEDTHFNNMQDTPFGSDVMTSAYSTPNSNHMHQPVQPGTQNVNQFDGRNQMNQDFSQDQPMNQAPQFFDLPSFSNEPDSMQQIPSESQQQRHFASNGMGDYWNSANAKRNAVTGLNPGGQGVNFNLDDLFGNGQGWGMGIELPKGANGANPMMNAWPGQSGPAWL